MHIEIEYGAQPAFHCEQDNIRQLLSEILTRAILDCYIFVTKLGQTTYSPKPDDLDWKATKRLRAQTMKYLFKEEEPDRFGSLHYIANHISEDPESLIDCVRRFIRNNPERLPETFKLKWFKLSKLRELPH